MRIRGFKIVLFRFQELKMWLVLCVNLFNLEYILDF